MKYLIALSRYATSISQSSGTKTSVKVQKYVSYDNVLEVHEMQPKSTKKCSTNRSLKGYLEIEVKSGLWI